MESRDENTVDIAGLVAVRAGDAAATGCLKGAVVGGVAGHYAGHHGVIGAAAGCLIGRHQAKKRAHVQQDMRHADPGRI
jgi:outer membrane lipoprotein SlyB